MNSGDKLLPDNNSKSANLSPDANLNTNASVNSAEVKRAIEALSNAKAKRVEALNHWWSMSKASAEERDVASDRLMDLTLKEHIIERYLAERKPNDPGSAAALLNGRLQPAG